jgi:DNA-binding NarL/FixJ family response regulator
MNNGTYHILLVEDDTEVIAHFSEIIQSSPKFNLHGVANSIKTARQLIDETIDLVLLDIGLPDGSGLDFIPEIKKLSQSKILIVTTFGDRETVVSAFVAGADGYLLKDSSTHTIIEGVELTLAGGAPVSASAAVYLLERLRYPVANHGKESPLSPREVELLNLFAKGYKYKEAAKLMEISPLTVGNHVKSIYKKLEVNSRSEAVYEAVTSGYLDL